MSFSLAGFLSLRPSVLVGLILLWNLMVGISVYLNGGSGRILDPRAAVVGGAACLAAAVFCYAVLAIRAVRRSVMRPGHVESFDRSSFFLVGAIALLLGVVLALQGTGVLGQE